MEDLFTKAWRLLKRGRCFTNLCALVQSKLGAPGAMERLRNKGASLGLNEDEIQQALNLGRSKQELAWVMCSDLSSRAQDLAREVFEQERIQEYECYDARWQSQGRAIITLKDWEDRENCLFTGSHGPASDGYYSWFAEHQMGLENGLYHVCACEASRCRLKKPKGA